MSVDFDHDMGYGTCQITFKRTSADGRPKKLSTCRSKGETK